MNSTEIIRNYIDNQLHYPRVNRAGDIDEVTLPSTETIIISYADISITGTSELDLRLGYLLITLQMDITLLEARKNDSFSLPYIVRQQRMFLIWDI